MRDSLSPSPQREIRMNQPRSLPPPRERVIQKTSPGLEAESGAFPWETGWMPTPHRQVMTTLSFFVQGYFWLMSLPLKARPSHHWPCWGIVQTHMSAAWGMDIAALLPTGSYM